MVKIMIDSKDWVALEVDEDFSHYFGVVEVSEEVWKTIQELQWAKRNIGYGADKLKNILIELYSKVDVPDKAINF